MKKNIFLIILLAFLFGCENESNDLEFTHSEKTLCLEAPNKEMISPDIVSLKMLAADVISIKTGIDSEFELQKITYLPADKGYIAVVDYKMQDGTISNFFIVKDANVKYKSSTSTLIDNSFSRTVKTREEAGSGGQTTVFSCLPDGKCEECKLLGEYDDNDKVHTLSCSCNDCKMKVTTR